MGWYGLFWFSEGGVLLYIVRGVYMVKTAGGWRIMMPYGGRGIVYCYE